MFPYPVFAIARSRLALYLGLALLLLIIVGGVYLKIKTLQHRVAVLSAQVQQYRTAYEAQKVQAERANAAVREIQRRYQQLSGRLKRLQAVHKEAVNRYRRLLAQCMKRKPQQPVTIKVVEKEECPRIELKEEGDSLLERLNGLFEEGSR